MEAYGPNDKYESGSKITVDGCQQQDFLTMSVKILWKHNHHDTLKNANLDDTTFECTLGTMLSSLS